MGLGETKEKLLELAKETRKTDMALYKVLSRAVWYLEQLEEIKRIAKGK